MTTIRAVLAAIALLPGAAFACAFHGYAPPPSTVDYLLDSSRIVLARPVPENPFRFEPVRTVRGQAGDAAIPFLVDTASRRRLGSNPDDAVLFAYDPVETEWRRISYVGQAERPVFETILARLPDWQSGDPRDRFQFFAGLLEHESATVRYMALVELDQANYGVLRSLDLNVPAAALLDRLNEPAEASLRPARLLLLGLTGDKAADQALRAGFERLLTSPMTGSLGAYATALIEAEGAAALDLIESQVLERPDMSLDTREQVAGALALHHLDGDPALRPRIASLVRQAVTRDPAMAAPVARQFGFHGDWSQADTLAPLLQNRRLPSMADHMTVVHYIGLASDFGTADRAEAQGDQE